MQILIYGSWVWTSENCTNLFCVGRNYANFVWNQFTLESNWISLDNDTVWYLRTKLFILSMFYCHIYNIKSTTFYCNFFFIQLSFNKLSYKHYQIKIWLVHSICIYYIQYNIRHPFSDIKCCMNILLNLFNIFTLPQSI